MNRATAARLAIALALVTASLCVGLWTRPEAARAAHTTDAPGAGASASRDTVSRDATGVAHAVAPGLLPATPSAPPAAAAATDDPVRVALASGASIVGLYDAQGRDDLWADQVERFIEASYGEAVATIMPGASAPRTECKTSICRTSFDVPEEMTRSAMWRAQHLTVAEGVSPYAEDATDDGMVRVTVYAWFAAEHRDADALRSHWRDETAARFPGGLSQMKEFLEAEEQRLRTLMEGSP